MAFVLAWSALLAAGFTYATVAGVDESSATRTAVYALLAAFTALLAARTAYEMVRRLRSGGGVP